MSEKLQAELTPQQRVFGNAFSFNDGPADDQTQTNYFRERTEAILDGKTVWLSPTLDADSGVFASLFKNRHMVATLDFDFEYFTADVWVYDGNGEPEDIYLCHELDFDDAVKRAEDYAATL